MGFNVLREPAEYKNYVRYPFYMVSSTLGFPSSWRYSGVVGFGYPRAARLARKRDIDLVYRKGRRFGISFLRLHVRPNGLGVSRLALSISSRLCNAVLRNRWKRLLRESLRLHPVEVGAGLDIIAVPTRPPGGLKQPQVEQVFLELIRRVRRELPTPDTQ